MRNFFELAIWIRSHHLTMEIYKLTKEFPKSEFYGLISQMRRSSSSIPTNIAEGCGRKTNPEFIRFLVIAAGSCSELHYQLILSHDLGYLQSNDFKELQSLVIYIRKMIFKFISRIEVGIPDT